MTNITSMAIYMALAIGNMNFFFNRYQSQLIVAVIKFNGDLILWQAVKSLHVKRNTNSISRQIEILPNAKLNRPVICYKKIRMLRCML